MGARGVGEAEQRCLEEGTRFLCYGSAASTSTAELPKLPFCFPLPCKSMDCLQLLVRHQYPIFLLSALDWRGKGACMTVAKGQAQGQISPSGTPSPYLRFIYHHK